jgi:hypothetical protein
MRILRSDHFQGPLQRVRLTKRWSDSALQADYAALNHSRLTIEGCKGLEKMRPWLV